MPEELEGVLDSNNLNDSKNNGHYLDVADEEVHFSRFHQLHLGQFVTAAPGTTSYQPLHHHHHQDSPLSSIETTAFPSFSSFTDIHLDHVNNDNHQSQDQAKSSRLLTCLGSKLRRGSNYYLAAPKLVGQYLLGITIQSWFEFLDTSRLVRAPSNTQQLTKRLVANLNHFQGNYLCVSLILIIYCILTSPLLLLAILAYLISLYAITVRTATGRHFRIANFRPNLQQQYSFVTLISLPLLWVAGAPSAVFWVIGASFVVVGIHASMYSQQRLEPPTTGALGAATSNEPLPVRANSNNQQQALGAHRLSVPSFSQQTSGYYNHSGTTLTTIQGQQQQYLSIPSSPLVSSSSSNNNSSEQPNNRYTSALVQWISFGSSSSSSSNSKKHSKEETSKTNDHQRLPDVTVISQDYAGLGRVYEI